MKVIFDDRQKRHDPKHFFAKGKALSSPEQPARAEALLKGARSAGCIVAPAIDFGMGSLAATHSPEYLTFLQTIHARWCKIDNAGDEVIPNVHPDRRAASYPMSPVGQAGYHQADTACPIGRHTWESSYWSAQTALTAADRVLKGECNAYALCRPPGHHAFVDVAGGFCFLNNSAIAAQHFVNSGLRPAILDIDVHHGNGTQGIFYHRSDVLTLSLHGDPSGFYPFFWGHAHERGEGAGTGFNLNLPLALGLADNEYLRHLDIALQRIQSFGATVLVVALGLDAYENDPLKWLAITTRGFGRIAQAIAHSGLPTLLVQEGGYLSPALPDNLASVLSQFPSGHA